MALISRAKRSGGRRTRSAVAAALDNVGHRCPATRTRLRLLRYAAISSDQPPRSGGRRAHSAVAAALEKRGTAAPLRALRRNAGSGWVLSACFLPPALPSSRAPFFLVGARSFGFATAVRAPGCLSAPPLIACGALWWVVAPF